MRWGVPVAALTVVAFALRVRGIGEGLYEDELYTISHVRGASFPEMLDAVATGDEPGAPRENTPPLFFVLAWLSARAGDVTTFVRLPSVVLGAATVPLVYLVGVRTVGRPAALVAATFVALSPFAIFYGTEARAYAALTFFATLATLVLLEAVQRPCRRWWAAYAVSLIALLYTHYTGALVIAVHGAWVLWRHRELWRPLLLADAGAGAAFAFWLPYLRSEPADYGALAGILGFDHWDAFLQWAAGAPRLAPEDLPGVLPLALLGTGVVVGLVGRVRRGSTTGLGPVLPLALVAPVFCLLYGFVGVDLFLFPRNMIASLPFAALAIGWSLTPPDRTALIAAVTLAGTALSIGAVKTLEDRFHRPDFPAAARLLDERIGAQDLVVHFGDGFAPIVLGRILPLYTERAPAARALGPDEASVTRLFAAASAAKKRVVLVELQDHVARVHPPTVPGWEQRDRELLPGNPAMIVATYTPLRAQPPPAVTSDRFAGSLDVVAREGGSVLLIGWAVGPRGGPAERVLAFADDRLLAAGVPDRSRPDVSEVRGVDAQDLGYALALPGDIEPAELAAIRLYAVADRVAGALPVVCTPQVRELLRC